MTIDEPTTNAGAKHDAGKLLAGCLLDFPRALQAVAGVSTFGAQKYSRGSWQSVPDGLTRYRDAQVRHMLAGAIDERDDEGGLLHAAHEAWNALAVLELKLREVKK